MKKLRLLLVLLISLACSVNAIAWDGSDDYSDARSVEHVFSFNFGPAWMTLREVDKATGRRFSDRMGYDYQASYTCCFMSEETEGIGWGIGLLGAMNRTEYFRMVKNYYLAPQVELIMGGYPYSRFRFKCNLGIGVNSFDSQCEVGANFGGGLEYQLSKYFGLGLDLGFLAWKPSNPYENTDKSNSRFTVMIGAKFHL